MARTRSHLAILLTLALFAAACGGGSESATDDAPATTEAESAEVVEDDGGSSAEAETTTQAPTTTEAEPAAEPDTSAVETEAGAGDGTPVNGQEVYEARCASCHGVDGVGTRGPDLIGISESLPDTQAAIDQVINGGNGMPGFGERLSPEEIQATVDYIYATF